MKNNFSRRTFLKRATAAGLLGALTATGMSNPAKAAELHGEKLGTLIDLTRCDGCPGSSTPLCVTACRQHNQERFPEPQKPLKYYWPQKKVEDWSDKRDLTTRLTPYNWTFVDKVKVEHNGIQHEVHVPRRCMHCDNPTCMKLCPFSAISKESTGAVSIDDGVCFGGAKCRDVCPWGIPQRQAGVGLYLQVAPDLAGGGVMYKCDLCSDLLAVGKKPACIQACPREALTIGPREEIQALARKKAQDIGGYVYGDLENGGTSTLYISSVPFEKIDQAIKADKKQKEDNSPGRPGMPVKVDNYLESEKGLFYSALLAPFAGAAAAGITAYRTLNGDSAKSSSPNPVNPGEEEKHDHNNP
ncbi:Fe-S-cluster-containing hydrogenase subunit [Desulfitobacterium dehalogenans ATCC 51507]|uniref:Fe-S-cluster-containing hydrogenase subunit n=1 Tax=Desulfitobacterium dehalogenans (strain ATCC 51507 / DSM 9161 / JW/IU-DC1) TaxID=756499 RepID=I4ADK7_DESDJ|nr:4Fe-4S dicluster domain-containing protein [Desulfitobacterium dehalogenans]AFM02042.1 Fe-S-cluster-containing hydrogenase subunit [Desulfitobacterium dehalogenans ATCC 51507]